MALADDIQKRIAPLFPGLMGIEIKEATQDKIVATMLVRPDLCTAGGVLHGGAYMAFADTIGAVGTAALGFKTATLESKTNFFAAGRTGVVRAESTPLHRGKTTMVWQTRVTDERGKLLSLTIQTQMIL